MKRDIDEIIEELIRKFPTLKVVQMHKTHPADDDGLWWFRLPGKQKDIQVESSTSNCPFLIESDDDNTFEDRRIGRSVAEVVEKVSSYLRLLAQES